MTTIYSVSDFLSVVVRRTDEKGRLLPVGALGNKMNGRYEAGCDGQIAAAENFEATQRINFEARLMFRIIPRRGFEIHVTWQLFGTP